MDNSNTHEISLQTAIDMTTLYRANRPANFPICETFEKAVIYALLREDDCEFLRIYYGMKKDNSVDAILVAVNACDEDILPGANSVSTSATVPLILEDGYRCPDACPPPSPLNQP